MRITRYILLTALLATAAGSLAWLVVDRGVAAICRQPANPGLPRTSQLPGEDVQLCANWTDAAMEREAEPSYPVLRRLPPAESSSELAVPSVLATDSAIDIVFPALASDLTESRSRKAIGNPELSAANGAHDIAVQSVVQRPPLDDDHVSRELNMNAVDSQPGAGNGWSPQMSDSPSRTTSDDEPEHRFAGVQDFSLPMEADNSWQSEESPSSPAQVAQLLRIQLPDEVVARTKSMLADATNLANRGAHFAARQQFEKIMRVTCQALDAQIGQSIHSRALARGLRAIEEAEDFGMHGDSAESDLHLGGYIAGHRTPILKDVPSSQITSLLAMQAYYRYAVDQLSIAGNNEPISSQALFSLGRIEDLLSRRTGDVAGGGPKALAFYHAALAVDARNGRAANELGVMLARRGRLQDACSVFHRAAASEPTAVANLSKVYGQIGDAHRAQQYAQQARQIAASNPAAFQQGAATGVRWVDHSTFVKSGSSSELPAGAAPIQRATNTPHGKPVVAPARSANEQATRVVPPTRKIEKSRQRSRNGWAF